MRRQTLCLPAGLIDDACEVLFDEAFPGGTDLHGRATDSRGTIIAADELLNLARPQLAADRGGFRV
jgi:Xrn1 SH3-like domain